MSEWQHEPQRQRFVWRENDQEAVVEYHRLGPKAVDFHHTYVPFALRGSGVAAQLVDAALDWADREGLAVQASCWYVEKRRSARG